MLFLSRINSSHHLRLQREGGSRKIDDDKGEAGVSIPPKRDDVIYEQPLILMTLLIISLQFRAEHNLLLLQVVDLDEGGDEGPE